jgi:hypothetical protein
MKILKKPHQTNKENVSVQKFPCAEEMELREIYKGKRATDVENIFKQNASFQI